MPFMGAWLIAQAGTGAVTISTSPFDLSISFLGQPLQSSLVGLFLLFTKIAFVIAGIFLIMSSLFPTSWWSKRLFGFGVMRPFGQVVYLAVLLVIAALVANILLPSVLVGLLGGAGGFQISTLVLPIVFIVVFVVSIYVIYKLFSRLLAKISHETVKSQLKGNIILTSIFIATLVACFLVYQRIPAPSTGSGGTQVNLSIPYVSGTTTSTIQIGNTLAVALPITLSLTGIFWVAVATAVVCIIARVYQGRYLSGETTERQETRKVMKLKPTEKKVLKLKAK